MRTIPWRSTIAQAPRDFLYVTVGGPLGFVWFMLLVTALSVGIASTVAVIGIPIVAVTLLLWRWGANTERERAALVLGAPIPRPPRPRTSGGLATRWRSRVTDRAAWKELGYMLLLGPVGVISGAIVIALWSGVLAALAAPAFSSVAPHQSVLGGLDALAFVGIVAGGVLLTVVSVAVTRGLALACAAIATSLLAPDERAVLAARVDALDATRLGAMESADARLWIARAKLADDPDVAAELLAGAHEESKRAMVEPRDLVRGIHPSVLSDRGLDAAVSGLAERSPVPVDVDVRLEGRPPSAVAVPSGTAVRVDSGAGNVTATQLVASSSVQLSSGAGDASATRISAPRVTLSSGAGDVTAQLTVPVGQLHASAGAGDVRLTVPDSTYEVHASSGAATVSDQTVRIDPSSPRKIDATSGAGDVTVGMRR